MEQYIPKAAVVAEIEKRKHKLLDNIMFEHDKEWVVRTAHQLNRIIMFLDTLEVKEVGLDYIKEELDRLVRIHKPYGDFGRGTLYNVATHFFKLGLRASNPLTWEDISSLKLLLDEVENEFKKGLHNDKSYIGYCKEVLKRFKAQKNDTTSK